MLRGRLTNMPTPLASRRPSIASASKWHGSQLVSRAAALFGMLAHDHPVGSESGSERKWAMLMLLMLENARAIPARPLIAPLRVALSVSAQRCQAWRSKTPSPEALAWVTATLI